MFAIRTESNVFLICEKLFYILNQTYTFKLEKFLLICDWGAYKKEIFTTHL